MSGATGSSLRTSAARNQRKRNSMTRQDTAVASAIPPPIASTPRVSISRSICPGACGLTGGPSSLTVFGDASGYLVMGDRLRQRGIAEREERTAPQLAHEERRPQAADREHGREIQPVKPH